MTADTSGPPLRCDRSPDPLLCCQFVAGHRGMHQADGHWWGSWQRAAETGDLREPLRDALAEHAAGEAYRADNPHAAAAEFPPALAAQGPTKPAGNSAEDEPDDEDAVRCVHDDCDPDWCASEGHQVCGYAVLITALDQERQGRRATWSHNEVLASQRDAARDLAAALEAELARVRDAVNVGATPALIAEILDEATDG